MYQTNESKKLFFEAQKTLVGGVNSPVRAFKSVGGTPLFIKKTEGAYIWDEDNNKYVDFVGSWGPAIVGHTHPEVLEEIVKVAQNGFSFGAPTKRETLLAEAINNALPSMEKIRLVSSGTEACMSAIRVARAFTGRSKILKFTGCYHGHGDSFLVKAGSGVATLGLPDSLGVPESVASNTLVVPFNDPGQLEEMFARNKDQIAAVIVEPYIGNAGFIKAQPGFLPFLRKITGENGSLLIFDEVMTGFRVAFGGVQILEKITPDLTTLGKVIGGGFPLAAYGGKKEIMDMIAPLGPVYQAGTLSGNPIAVAAGQKTLEILSRAGSYTHLSEVTQNISSLLVEEGKNAGFKVVSDSAGGMFGFFFSASLPKNFEEVKVQCSQELFNTFFHAALREGIYLAPSAFEACFVSLAHGSSELLTCKNGFRKAFQALAANNQ